MDELWVTHLQCHEQRDGLNWIEASVNKVAHEEIVCEWEIATNWEQLDQIVELAMDVPTDGHWCSHGLYVWLLHEDTYGKVSDEFNLLLGDTFELLQVADYEIQFAVLAHLNTIRNNQWQQIMSKITDYKIGTHWSIIDIDDLIAVWVSFF